MAVSGQVQSMFGDEGPWIAEIPRLFRMLAWPEGDVRRPVVPWTVSRGGEKVPIHDHARRTRYWAPLLQLAWWYYGWADPAVAALEALRAGLPPATPGMRVVSRWWGRNIAALALWEAEVNCNLRQHGLGKRSIEEMGELRSFVLEVIPRSDLEALRTIYDGGTDGLHVAWHATFPMEQPSATAQAQPLASFEDPFPRQPIEVLGEGTPSVVILLRSYANWYYWLYEVTQSLGPANDCSCDVIVLGLGWLGRYRQSPNTGIWHAGQEWEHMLGNGGHTGNW